MDKSSRPDNRFYILDPLRFLAAYGVLFYHYSIYLNDHELLAETFKYGYLGVNFFFLLSGFVIMISAQQRNAFEFAYARAARIYPTFILCLVFTILTVYLFSDQRFTALEIFSNASILNDYLGIANIDGVYWTLQAELKFYGCVFLLLLFGILHRWRWWVGIWLSLAITHHFFNQPFFLGWFINPEYSFYFIGGVCAYQIYVDRKSSTARYYFCIALLFACLKSIDQTQDFLTRITWSEKVIAAFCSVAFFAFFYFLANGAFVLQKSSFLISLGMISYPLYLIHNKAGKLIYEYVGQWIGEIETLLITSALVIGVCGGINYLIGLIPGFHLRLNKVSAKKINAQ